MNASPLPDWLAPPSADLPQAAVGTKAMNLSALVRFGYKVPECLFVTTLGSEFATFDACEDYYSAISDFSARLPAVLPSANGWAVRSSATVEDMPGESHAGRFETLFIRHASELADAVKTVWDSGSAAGIGPESMGVVLQRLVDADFAGVAFSNDPIRNDGMTVIEAVPGTAARFVDGEVTPCRIRPGQRDSVLPDGFFEASVDALDNGVQDLARRLDTAVDTEWAVADGELYWLQVRPLTGATSSEFVIPESQKADLRGLWVRINHSFAPQATLVASMNPGGYFDGPGWKSCLVNGFHYIQEQKRTRDSVPVVEFDRVLDEWDDWEIRFGTLYEARSRVQLDGLSNEALWQEIVDRIELSREYFTQYSDPRFLEIRERTEQRVTGLVEAAAGDSVPPGAIVSELLGQLGSLTDEKQRQLRNLARICAENPHRPVDETAEWRAFIEQFGSESPTTHLFYLPTLKESSDLVIEMVRQMSTESSPVRQSGDWQRVAADVESKLPQDRRTEFATELTRLRRCMLRTENDDYALSKCTMMVRDAYLEAAQRLRSDGVLDEIDDVFHLSGDELSEALGGTASRSLHAVIAERRSRFAAAKLLSPPPMIVNGRAMAPKAEKSSSKLSGTPASPGVASGTVLVLNDPFSCVAKRLPRNAVVVAPVVTPSLAYSLIGCSAVITEIGGLASHGAIVARELAIPAVVGVGRARALLQTGMSVTVDGSQGEINILGTRQ